MRLFWYYALHSLKNQIRKLFKTWVFILILACMVLGGVIGLGAAWLSEMHEEDNIPEEEALEEIFEPEEEAEEFSLTWDPGVDRDQMIELVAGVIVLVVLVFDIVRADKSGSKIFLPADVNLLFPSPMKPQTVLMFRLTTQLGTAILASLYICFQIPNLMNNVGLDLRGALGLVLAWCLTIVTGRLLQLLFYTLCSARPGMRNTLRRAVYGLLLLLAASFVLYRRNSGEGILAAAVSFFNAPVTRYIPFWGWVKGFAGFAVSGDRTGALLCLGAVILGSVLLAWIIWHIKADFYEDAMAKSEETAELLEKAQRESSGGVRFVRRKNDRSDRLRRDGLRRGEGASVFFYKTMYNRFRFAHLGFLTKTAETYLVAAAATAVLCRYAWGYRGFLPAALVLAGFAFFRALGNPLEQDTKMAWFLLIPETCRKKLFWSLMGGTACCVLDVLPGIIAAVLILWTGPLAALAWIPFIVSVDFYSTTVGTFIDLSVPVAAGKTVKQVVQVLFIYFGLVPDAVLLVIGFVMGHVALAAVAAAAVNVGLGFLFFWFSPLFLEPGSGKEVSFGTTYTEVAGGAGGR